MAIQDHPHPALTADVVLFALGEDGMDVLLIQRDRPPFEGAWAFPGGFVNLGEAPHDAARRELEEETGIRDPSLEQLRAFGDPERDPRGHVVTIAYLAVISKDISPQAEAGSDAAQIRWWSLDELPPLAFDHADILASALRRLRSRLQCILEPSDLRTHDLKPSDVRSALAAAAQASQRLDRPPTDRVHRR